MTKEQQAKRIQRVLSGAVEAATELFDASDLPDLAIIMIAAEIKGSEHNVQVITQFDNVATGKVLNLCAQQFKQQFPDAAKDHHT